MLNRTPTDMIIDRQSGQKLSEQLADIAYNVKSFDVKGDNASDDTVNLTNALKSNYTTILLPDGVFKITDTMLINTGSDKKVIGSKNTVLSIQLTSSKTFLDTSINIAFENITFDFNNGFVKNGLLYAENLGRIVLRNVKFINVKDTDSTTGSLIVYIPSKGNVIDIDTIEFNNLKKRGNGSITDANGSLTCLYLADRITAAPIIGTVKNLRVIDVHNIDSNDAIIFEDTAGIYPASGYNGTDGVLTIENVYGYNFGKRLIKTHTSNVNIRDVYGYSDTHDTLAVIGLNTGETLGDKKNIKISNIQAFGNMNMAIAISATDVKVDGAFVDIQKPVMTGNANNAYGFHLSSDDVSISNAIVSAERCVLLNKSSIIKNIKISRSKFTVPSWGVYAIQVASASMAFENLVLSEVDVYSYSTAGMNTLLDTFSLDGTANKIGKGLIINNCTLYTTVLNAYSLYLRNIEDVSIINFKFSNDGVNKAYRGGYFDACKKVRINNFICNGFAQASIQIKDCDDVKLTGLNSPSSDFSLSNSNSTKVRVKDIDKGKITLNDTVALQNTFVEQESSYGTTVNRPTNVTAGHPHFDTTLNKPIWRNTANNGWVDATGATV